MEQSDLLRYVVERLEKLGLRYFVTGSAVTVYWRPDRPRLPTALDWATGLD